MSSPARIISNFERGMITYKQMQRQLSKAAIRRNRKAIKRNSKIGAWK